MEIKNYVNAIQEFDREKVLARLQNIFFETSARSNFENKKVKDEFCYYYLDYFLERFPRHCFCAFDAEDNLLGYIVATPNTLQCPELFQYHAYLNLFSSYMSQFPAQLHINLTAKAQGMGVGGKLIGALETKLMSEDSLGLFLITGRQARNISFYQKHHFDTHFYHEFKSNSLIFMGKKLS